MEEKFRIIHLSYESTDFGFDEKKTRDKAAEDAARIGESDQLICITEAFTTLNEVRVLVVTVWFKRPNK